MFPPSWSTFSRRIPVNASIEKLYAAWATQAGLEQWFLRQAVFTSPEGTLRGREELVQASDRFLWLWHGWSDDHPEKKEILAANDKDFFQFSFSGNCIVSVEITTEQNVNFVNLTQSKIPENLDPKENLHVACSNGWTFYLTNLKSVLEGGLDLRNRDLTIQNVVNA